MAAPRREAIEALRGVIRAHLDPSFEEGIQYGMIGYFLPHAAYPKGYHVDPRQPLPLASIASQKHHIGLYLFCLYMDDGLEAWFRDAWTGAGKRLDMGKSCVRVRSLEDVPLEVVGALFARVTADDFVAAYEAGLARGGRHRASARTAARKQSGKRAATKKAAAKKRAGRNAAGKKRSAKNAARKQGARPSTAAGNPARASAKRAARPRR